MDLCDYLEYTLESQENIMLILKLYIEPMKYNSLYLLFHNWGWINFQAIMVYLLLSKTFTSFNCFCIKLDLYGNILFNTNCE